MVKYDPLRGFLRSSGRQRVAMTFDQIAALVGPLPKSAYEYQAWWAKETEPQSPVQEFAWKEAGYIIEPVDVLTRIVSFHKR